MGRDRTCGSQTRPPCCPLLTTHGHGVSEIGIHCLGIVNFTPLKSYNIQMIYYCFLVIQVAGTHAWTLVYRSITLVLYNGGEIPLSIISSKVSRLTASFCGLLQVDSM